MKAWGPERTIRAPVLQHLLVEKKWTVHPKGVQMRGVKIKGVLDLEAATLRCPLRLEKCYLDGVILNYATVSLLEIKGCYLLAGLSGYELLAAKGLNLDGLTSTGRVSLISADITGQLLCRGAVLVGANAGYALVADGMKVSDAVLLDELTAEGVVQLLGADITGQLSCRGAYLTGAAGIGDALAADEIKVSGSVLLDGLTAEGAVGLRGADITGQLSCRGAYLTGAHLTGAAGIGDALAADEIKVGGDVNLDKDSTAARAFTAAGTVRLASASISGQLSCAGAELTAPGGDALAAAGIKVGADVNLDGLIAQGSIRLRSADIAGHFKCVGAELTAPGGDALTADMITVGTGVQVKGLTAKGTVRLPGADITGQLRCADAHFSAGADGYALLAEGIKVSADMSLVGTDTAGTTGSFTADGMILLRSADVGGTLRLEPEQLPEGKDAEGNDKVALDASGSQIAHELQWAPSRQIAGLVNLEDATVGQLSDSWNREPDGRERHNGYWPKADEGRLRLSGFTYHRFGGEPQVTVEDRLEWIGSEPKPPGGIKRVVCAMRAPGGAWRRSKDKRARWHARHYFATQPYEQLAKVYQQAGQDEEARKVAIAQRRDLRRYGKLNRYRRLGNWLLDNTIRYGYGTWRAGADSSASMCSPWRSSGSPSTTMARSSRYHKTCH